MVGVPGARLSSLILGRGAEDLPEPWEPSVCGKVKPLGTVVSLWGRGHSGWGFRSPG